VTEGSVKIHARSQATAEVQMRSTLFCYVTKRRLVVIDVSGQPIGPIFEDKAMQFLTDV
jgi:hypothetical protein